MKNCYDGKGADNVGRNPYSDVLSLSDCQYHCEVDDSCEGIIVGEGIIREDRGRCHKRRNIQLCDCSDQAGYNLYVKVADGQSKPTCRVEEITSFLNRLLYSHGENYLEKLFGPKARHNLEELGGVNKVAIALLGKRNEKQAA